MKFYSILKLNRLAAFIFLFVYARAVAQYGVDPDYFMFPIRPGERNYLAGTMGEIRGTHFHAGIDIRTSGVEGLPVYAAAEGYISRIKITTNGYGNALYLTHPNGLTTVYGHLKTFSKEIAAWVRAEQYRKKSFEVDLFPAEMQFVFKKGDVIAASGNSGGSSGPHLHFEIRDKHQQVLDPMRFDFPELIDTAPPLIRNVAFTTMDQNSRVNGQFGRFEFDVKQEGGAYVVSTPLNLYGSIGVEIYAYDRFDGTWSKNGIPCIEVMWDSDKLYSQSITRLSFDEMRNVAVHMNYGEYVSGGPKFTRLWVDDGNWLKVYETNDRRGLLKVKDSLKHRLEIRTWDTYNNYSYLKINVDNSRAHSTTPIKNLSVLKKDGFEITGNIMELMNSNGSSRQNIIVFARGFQYELAPAYHIGANDFYLWDLRKGLPDSVDMCSQMRKFDFRATVSPHHEFTYRDNDTEVAFNRYSLFDTLYLAVKPKQLVNNKEIYAFDNLRNPLRRTAKVTLKPAQTYDKARSGVYTYSKNGDLGYVGGAWEDNKISFLTNSLATYTIVTDSVAPSIRPTIVNAKECRFIIEDGMSGVKSWEATINGEWVLMNYDYKTRLLWSEKLDASIPFEGEFMLLVTDNAGNQNFYKTKL